MMISHDADRVAAQWAFAVGKTSVAGTLVSAHGFQRLRTGPYLADLARARGAMPDRTTLQCLGDRLDEETNFRWVLDDVAIPAFAADPQIAKWLFDCVRKPQQVRHFKETYGDIVVHVHLTATEDVLRARYRARLVAADDYAAGVSYEEAIAHPNEIAARSLIESSDIVIDMTARDAESAADHLAMQLARQQER